MCVTSGNTPGHLNHWTRRSFVALLGRYGEVVRGPVAVPVDDAARAVRVSPVTAEAAGALRRAGPGAPGAAQSFASGARILSIGIASTGIFTFAYLAVASHDLSPASYSRMSLCWAIMFVILSVIYRPIEQLLSGRSPTAAPEA